MPKKQHAVQGSSSTPVTEHPAQSVSTPISEAVAGSTDTSITSLNHEEQDED